MSAPPTRMQGEVALRATRPARSFVLPMPMSKMRIRLSDERKEAILASLEELFLEEFDEELSRFRGSRLLDFFVEHLGPPVYNQAIQDARGFLLERLDDLDVEFYEPDVDL